MKQGRAAAWRGAARSVFFGGLHCLLVGLVLTGPARAQIAVSDGGQPGYSVPIPAPPGTGGVEPKLALQYNRGSAGPFAAGWSLAGLSVITRCGSTKATDGVRKGVRYTSEDRFCLDGQRLVLTDKDGNPFADQTGYGTPGSEYRTEKDAYSRVRAYGGSPVTGPDSFKVWTKSGLIYEFGATSDSLITTVGRLNGVTMAWAVNKISDTTLAGNYMTISYLNQANMFAGSLGREWMVYQVRYTGNYAPPPNRLEFVYEDRPDKSEAYHEGVKSVNTKRLAYVVSYLGNTTTGDRPISQLNLQYDISPNTGRSLLKSVQQCAGAALTKCLPKTEFGYSQGPGPTFTSKSLDTLSLSRKDNIKGYTRGVYQGDFNGDGKLDLLVWDDDPTQNQLLLSNGDGTFTARPQPLPGNPQIGHSNGCYYISVADFNADGISDVLQIQDPDARPGCSGVPRLSRIFLGQATGIFQSPITLTKSTGEALALMRVDAGMSVCAQYAAGNDSPCIRYDYFGGRNYSIVDINGDGLPDILFTRTPPNATYDTRPSVCGPGELTCVFLGTTTVGSFTSIPTSLAQENLFAPGGWLSADSGVPGSYQADRIFIGDLNGDGLPDVFVRDTGVLYTASSTAGQFTKRQAAPMCVAGAEVLDINGDGKWDVACMDYTDSGSYKAYINDGAGNFVFRSNISNWTGTICSQGGDGVGVITCDPVYRSFIRYLAADLDGDGISDILALGKSRYGGTPPEYNGFLKGQRDGSFTSYPIASLASVPFAWETRQLLVGDFTGRGTVELLRYSENSAENALYKRDDSMPADLLQTVTTMGNVQTSINYKPLTDSSVYTRGTGAIYPVVDYGGAQWVVSSVNSPNGRGGVISSTYEYSQQRADLTGRGRLGFWTVKQTSPGADGTLITSLTTNRQDFPFVGLPSETRRYLTSSGPGNWLSVANSSYSTICQSSTSPKIYRPVLSSTVEQNRDLSGAPISYVETVNSNYNNCFGDPGTVTITTRSEPSSSDSYTKQTVNVYESANTSGDIWILGRLKSAVQTNTVPQVTFVAPSSPGTGTTTLTPTISVNVAPLPMVVGQPATRTWSTTNATSASFSCTAAAGGYVASGAAPLSGSDTLTPLSSWVNNSSTCVWTATGSGGTTSVTQTLTTTPAIPLPTISVNMAPLPMVVGQTATRTWTTTLATSASFNCTAAAGGYVASGAAPLSGSDVLTPTAGWVNSPSSCVWTATGSGGTTTVTQALTTIATPLPTISVNVTPLPMAVGQTATRTWTTTFATSVSFSCSAAAGGYVASGSASLSGADTLMPSSGWVSSPSTCVYTATGAGGTTSVTQTLTTAPVPTISVNIAPLPMVVGQTATRTWSTTGATSATFNCTAAAGGYAASGAAPVSGSDTLTPTSGWINSPSNCIWTATGAGGSTTSSHVLTTVAPASPPPTISVSVSPDPLRVGQASTISWGTVNATSLGYNCTASGTGFNQSASVAVNSSTSLTGQSGWVGYPSNCVWTATGAGGSVSYQHSLTTVPALPTITVSLPSVMYVGSTYPLQVATTNADSVAYQCTGSGNKTGTLPANFSGSFTPDASWYGGWTCTWTATGAGGSGSTTTTMSINTTGGSGGE